MRSRHLRGVGLVAVIALAAGGGPAWADEEWPREIDTEMGLVVLYQPQLDSLEGDLLYGRAAVSVTPGEQDTPFFGAAWLEARIETDLDTRTVTLHDVKVPRVRFADASDEQQQQLSELELRMAETEPANSPDLTLVILIVVVAFLLLFVVGLTVLLWRRGLFGRPAPARVGGAR